jgi:hypothetical protein
MEINSSQAKLLIRLLNLILLNMMQIQGTRGSTEMFRFNRQRDEVRKWSRYSPTYAIIT